MSVKNLSIPSFFDPKKADQVWRVPYQDRAIAAKEWRKTHSLKPAAKDNPRVSLMIIDAQNTFCIPGFELFVSGAVEDNIRLCEFIYRNLGVISEIDPTMDTHTAMQIFHQVFLVNEKGENPKPMTLIALDDVEKGVWKINPEIAASVAAGNYIGLQRHLLHYARKLSEGGKYSLMIWPYHAMLGGIGHALTSIVEEACFFHNLARSSQTGFEIKGGNPLTENYSVLRAEVLEAVDGRPIAQKNTRFIKKLLDDDVVIIAGQAKSHCFAMTIDDLLSEIKAEDESLAKKVYLLEDCTSPVVVPGVIDFTDAANEAFKRFSDAGMHVVRSTDPVDRWPDLNF